MKKPERRIENDQLQLAFEQLCELRDMAPLLFKGMQVVDSQTLTARKRVLREQAQQIARRQA